MEKILKDRPSHKLQVDDLKDHMWREAKQLGAHKKRTYPWGQSGERLQFDGEHKDGMGIGIRGRKN